MYYNVLSLMCKPGHRFSSLEHLGKLASWFHDTYEIPSFVYNNASGLVYEHHLAGRYSTMEQIDTLNQTIMGEAWFQKWFKESENMLHWQQLQSHIMQIHRPTEAESWQHLSLISLNLIPGKRWDGVKHMGKLAEHLEEVYGVPTEVTSDMDGFNYRHHFISVYESLAEYEAMLKGFETDKVYHQWFTDAMDLMDTKSVNIRFARRY